MTALPDGATDATGFDQLDTRVVLSDPLTSSAANVRASAVQTRSGRICDDPSEESPRVHVALNGNGSMTFQQARQLASHLYLAARQAEQWACDAAKHRHPAGRGLAATGVEGVL